MFNKALKKASPLILVDQLKIIALDNLEKLHVIVPNSEEMQK